MKLPNEKAEKKFSFNSRFLTGLIIALAATLTAFEWTTVTTDPYVFGDLPTRGIEEIEDLPRFKIKELEKPKPKVEPKTDDLNIVDDIPDETIEPDPEPTPPEDNTPTTTDIDLGDYGMDETLPDEPDFYVTVQVFAHYDVCKGLEGDELKECAQLEIMQKIKEEFVVSEQLKDTGGKQYAQLSFIVDERGDITNIEVLRATCNAVGRDASKALQKLPRMNPAIQQGKNVKLRMTIPIKVDLQ